VARKNAAPATANAVDQGASARFLSWTQVPGHPVAAGCREPEGGRGVLRGPAVVPDGSEDLSTGPGPSPSDV